MIGGIDLEHRYFVVKHNGNTLHKFHVNSEDLQGSYLDPVLIILFVDYLRIILM